MVQDRLDFVPVIKIDDFAHLPTSIKEEQVSEDFNVVGVVVVYRVVTTLDKVD